MLFNPNCMTCIFGSQPAAWAADVDSECDQTSIDPMNRKEICYVVSQRYCMPTRLKIMVNSLKLLLYYFFIYKIYINEKVYAIYCHTNYCCNDITQEYLNNGWFVFKVTLFLGNLYKKTVCPVCHAWWTASGKFFFYLFRAQLKWNTRNFIVLNDVRVSEGQRPAASTDIEDITSMHSCLLREACPIGYFYC